MRNGKGAIPLPPTEEGESLLDYVKTPIDKIVSLCYNLFNEICFDAGCHVRRCLFYFPRSFLRGIFCYAPATVMVTV